MRIPSVLLLAATLLAACGSDDAVPFYASCESSDDCPAAWSCPAPGTPGWGTIANVCVPGCATDQDCREESGNPLAYCESNHWCYIECFADTDCPDTVPECRGANPSCENQPVGTLFCATEDFSCL